MPSYSIFWKYLVKDQQNDSFESVYGQRGAWNSLFRQSAAYKGSCLHRSADDTNVYLLIDTWTDRASYEAFKSQNRKSYESLSTQCETTYKSEELLGTFNAID
ncbi:MAG TPA: hypothetical protein VKN36_14250 [Eudoraea sp.]|nr:hypothetical protein [Eudoraea sp.]